MMILESLYKSRIRESAQLKTVLELYDMEIHQKISMPNNQKLKTMVKRSLDQKLRLRNFDAWRGRTGKGVVVQSRKGLSVVKEEKVFVTSGKKKTDVRNHCSFRHESNDRAQNPEHRMPPHFPSPRCREVEVCRRKEVSKAKVIILPFFDNRADTIGKVRARDRLVSLGILPNVNSIKTNRDEKQAMSVCSRIIR